MKIDERQFNRLPKHLQSLFTKLPNPGSDEVLAGFSESDGSGPERVLNRSGGLRDGDWGMNANDGDRAPLRDAGTGSAARFFASFPVGEEEWEFANSVQAARSAANPCALCGTHIAGDPAATLTLGFNPEASQAGQVSIGICSDCILNLGLAPSVDSPESTGTIPTIPICSESNGSVAPATASIIKTDARAKAGDGSAPASATRFLYCPKATTEERGEDNNHPTVKPVALMRWLCRLVTPKGGTVLDPFMGSGSTAVAADAEQFDFIGCEISSEYAEIARRRIADQAGMFAEIEVVHAAFAHNVTWRLDHDGH